MIPTTPQAAKSLIRPLALLLASASLAGCGGGDQPAQETAAVDTATPPAAAPAAPTTTAPATPAPAVTAATAPAPTDTATLDGTVLASFTGDAAAGPKAFAACRTCHVVDPDVNRIGPSLHGIVGRTAGTVADFNYSPANKNSGITWTSEKLFQYLEKPQRIVPGTKMIYPGQSKAQTRADLIAYLATQA